MNLEVEKMAVIVPKRQKYFIPLERKRGRARRNKYDILAGILAACDKYPRTQTWLLGHLGLSTSMTKNSLRFLAAAKLIKETHPIGVRTTKYKITRKGENALKTYIVLTTRYFST